MNIERAKTVQGFMHDEELEWLAEQAFRRKVIVEVGSWCGKSTVAMAANTAGTIWAVDPFDGGDDSNLSRDAKSWHGGSTFGEFLTNVADFPNVKWLKLRSQEAAGVIVELGSAVDMVFIDGSHDYESVKRDILTWEPVLVSSGILCGHDYAERCQGVKQAVEELLPGFERMLPVCEERSIWWRVK